MKVTIVTLYRAGACEHFVGAVEGAVSDLWRQEMARQFKAVYNLRGQVIAETEEALDAAYEGPNDDDLDQIFFREVEVCAAPDLCRILENIDDQS